MSTYILHKWHGLPVLRVSCTILVKIFSGEKETRCIVNLLGGNNDGTFRSKKLANLLCLAIIQNGGGNVM